MRPAISTDVNYEAGGGVYANLLDAYPPFQIDGNLGSTAGVCEMLLQSEPGQIQLLPALPKAWSDGKVTGLRASGGFTVDIEWKNGQVVNYRIVSPQFQKLKVHFNGEVKTIRSGKSAKATPLANQRL